MTDTDRRDDLVTVERRTWADDDLTLEDDTGEMHLTESGELVAATGEPHTGAMVALKPTVADAERLAVTGGEEPDELHLTLGYLGEAAMIPEEVRDALVDCVARCVEDWPTIIGDAFNVSLMNPDGPEPCVVLGVGGGQLDRAHEKIMTDVMRTISNEGLSLEPQHRPWLPHVTLVYTGEADLGVFTDRMGPIIFDRVCLAFGDEVMEIPLGDTGEYEEDDPDYEDDAAESYTAAGFRRGQRRDPHTGEWIDEPGSGTLSSDHVAKFTKKLGKARSGDRAYDDVPSTDAYGLTPKHRGGSIWEGTFNKNTIPRLGQAIDRYQSDGFHFNGPLRDGSHAQKWVTETHPDGTGTVKGYHEYTRAFDEAFLRPKSRTRHDIMIERGIVGPHLVFGDSWRDDNDNAGLEWVDGGFFSGTTDSSVAEHFTSTAHKGEIEGSRVIMRVLVPEGTPALRFGEGGSPFWKAETYGWEKEVMLPRDSRFRIVADHGVDAGGIHRVDVELVAPGRSLYELQPERYTSLVAAVIPADARLPNFIDIGPVVKIVSTSDEDAYEPVLVATSVPCLDCIGDLEAGDRVQLTHLGETTFATVFAAEDGLYELLLDDATDLNDRVWYPGNDLVPVGLTLDVELGDGFVTFARSQTVTRSDRNLKIYWTRGAGAAKIRWNTDGDFTRCVRHLRKYVRDPKGLCAVYHHMATGKWPHPHPGRPTE